MDGFYDDRSPAQACKKIRAKDLLIGVNGQMFTDAMLHADAMQIVAQALWPLTLLFLRPHSEDEEDKAEEEEWEKETEGGTIIPLYDATGTLVPAEVEQAPSAQILAPKPKGGEAIRVPMHPFSRQLAELGIHPARSKKNPDPRVRCKSGSRGGGGGSSSRQSGNDSRSDESRSALEAASSAVAEEEEAEGKVGGRGGRRTRPRRPKVATQHRLLQRKRERGVVRPGMWLVRWAMFARGARRAR